MDLTKDDVKELRKEESDENRKIKAEEYKAQLDHDADVGWTNFISRHSGAQAIANRDVYYSCEANHGILTDFIKEHNLDVDSNGVNLEQAFKDCRHRLAESQGEPYVRRTDTQISRIAPQVFNPRFPEPKAPYTQEQLIEMGNSEKGRAELRRAIKRYGLDAVNFILAGH